jgi:predicted short-subunit dehydrogenase-like oxidoreductase (DUF2520 family)
MLGRVTSKPSITIVGSGNLAQALGPALRRAGYRIKEVISRNSETSRRRARDLARRVGARATTAQRAHLDAEIVWLCVTDDAIAGAANALALASDWRGKMALHSSGALTADQLAPLRRRGAAVASVHPMMTFVRGAGTGFAGVAFAVEGDAAARRQGRRIARDLGGVPFEIHKESKVLYHAMGSFTSPLVVAVLALAERVADTAGIPRAKLTAAMQPILRKTFENYMRGGAAAAFSGPINRGDLETVRKHLTALQKVPLARDAYVALARAAAETLPVKRKGELVKLLRKRGS